MLKPDGVLAITVPPLKHNIVSHHVSLWNAGLLLYHLVLAGWDTTEAKVKQYDYNISVILRRKDIPVTDISKQVALRELSKYFPKGLRTGAESRVGFDGNIKELNWLQKEKLCTGT